jgi:outer membrane murein-binding lipoprotein Lpp
MRKFLITAGLIGAALLSGCNNAKSPDSVANDVAKAQQNAANNVADARKDAAKDDAKVAGKVDDQNKDLNNTEAKGAYDVALARADGVHKVSLAKCDVLSGDAQKGCKNQADADYDAAKANAKATETARKQ